MQEITIEKKPELADDRKENRQGAVYLIKCFDKPKPPNYDNTQTTHELKLTKQFIDMMQQYTRKNKAPNPKGNEKEEKIKL